VQVFDFGQENGQNYIAMTFVPGVTLSELLRQRRRLDIEEAILIVKQVARGLLYAHDKGVVHRDIKPSNIIISPDNRIRITDFGISHSQGTERLTSTGTAMGTPEYMSPEQCQGEDVTNQTDIYSIGIIFYEMLCGNPPFTGNKPLDIAYKQVHTPPESPSVHFPEIPPRLENLILKCLRKNKAERIQGASQFLAELDRVMDTPQANATQNSAIKNATRKVQSIIARRDSQRWLIPLAFGLIAMLTLLQVLLVLLQQKDKGVQVLTQYEISAAWEQRALEKDCPKGYPLGNLSDDNLETAWLLPANDIVQNPVIVIRFPKPTLVLNIGLAIGYQKSRDDELQDRFTMFQKPQSLNLRTTEGLVQRIQLQNVKGMQYPDIHPIETTELRLELRDLIAGSTQGTDLAISELRIVGSEISSHN